MKVSGETHKAAAAISVAASVTGRPAENDTQRKLEVSRATFSSLLQIFITNTGARNSVLPSASTPSTHHHSLPLLPPAGCSMSVCMWSTGVMRPCMQRWCWSSSPRWWWLRSSWCSGSRGTTGPTTWVVTVSDREGHFREICIYFCSLNRTHISFTWADVFEIAPFCSYKQHKTSARRTGTI